MTAQQLADELEVSVRTIYRDVEELSASGIPVFADRGAHGGFQLVEGYRTRLTGLTPQEAETLFLSGYPGPAAELGLGTVLAAAQLKVLAALPPELRSRASRIRQRFHLDAPGWFTEPEATPHLQQIADAVWSDRRLRMWYRRGADDQVVERLIDPLGVVLKAGVWYMVARTGDEERSARPAGEEPAGRAREEPAARPREELRTYRISRIVSLETATDRFQRPDDFDLAEHWERSVSAYESSLPSFEAVVRVHEPSLWRVADVIGGIRAREAIGAATRDGEGWLTLTLPLGDVGYAESQLLAFGADLEVVSPADFRERLAASARRMALLYS